MNLVKKLFFTILASVSILFVSSCNEETNKFVDYASSSEARLNIDYKGRSFLTDGIAQVTLKTAIDGDTAHFNEEGNSELLKIRFYGIDTPESTGKIQPWGKAASNFTKEKLKNANENGTIVISVPQDEYTIPSHDSTGTRYLGLVWFNEEVKDCDYKDLKLLNLLLVQEGYSEVKNATQMERLEPIFRSAWQQAKDYKLNMFSGEEDPLYNYGDYESVSLLDMKIELENEIAAEAKGETYTNKYDNAKVKVVGTVVGYANNILYIQNFYSKENGGRYEYGEYAGVNIYTGMSAIHSKFTTPNAYIQVCGTASNSENFGFQISGCSFRPYNPKENDAQVIIEPEDNNDEFKLYTFEKSASEVKQGNYEYINSPIVIKDKVKVTGGYTGDSASITLYIETESGEKIDFNVYIAFLYKPDESNPSNQWKSYEEFVGKTFTLKGIVSLHKTTSGKYNIQVLPQDSTDFALVS